MSENTTPVTVRLPASIIDELDELVALAERNPELLAYGAASRSSVGRMALAIGIQELRRRWTEQATDLP